MATFEEELRFCVGQAGMTPKSLAEKLGIHVTQVHKWGNGTTTPRRGTVERLLGAMGSDESACDRLLVAGGFLPRGVEERLLENPTLVRFVRRVPLGWVPRLLAELEKREDDGQT